MKMQLEEFEISKFFKFLHNNDGIITKQFSIQSFQRWEKLEDVTRTRSLSITSI